MGQTSINPLLADYHQTKESAGDTLKRKGWMGNKEAKWKFVV
jgi:hypothetical protein